MRKILMACCSLLLAASTFAADAPAKKSTPAAAMNQRPSIAYVALRIVDLDRSLKFYTGLLGMKERQRIPLDNGVSEILIGYGDPTKDAGILLLYSANRKEPYTHGDAYHRLILSVKDLPGMVANLKSNGVKVTREVTRVENLKLNYAFISDPDGYLIELVEND
jgi:lactoylglutathione lyase